MEQKGRKSIGCHDFLKLFLTSVVSLISSTGMQILVMYQV